MLGRDGDRARLFAANNGIQSGTNSLGKFLDQVDAVYVASPQRLHFMHALAALNRGRHVLCEKPLTLSSAETLELQRLARSKGLVFLEALKTAYAPGFVKLVELVREGVVGEVISVDAAFTKLLEPGQRETSGARGSGSLSELGSYPLLAVAKLLGHYPKSVQVFSRMDPAGRYDEFTRVSLTYSRAVATASVGFGGKTDGRLVVAGTSGFAVIPAPWWKAQLLEVRRESPDDVESHLFDSIGYGLVHEIDEFVTLVAGQRTESSMLGSVDSSFLQSIIDLSPTIGPLTPPPFELTAIKV